MQSEPRLTILPATLTATPPNRRVIYFALSVSGLALLFAPSLVALIRFALQSDLYSYILIVPLITCYLFYTGKNRFSEPTTALSLGSALAVAGVAVLLGWKQLLGAFGPLTGQDYLAGTSLSFSLCLVGLFALFFGPRLTREFSFALGFLVFLAPLPSFLEALANSSLQVASAYTAWQFFDLCGTPVIYGNLIFHLPGITFQVAPECSGIHSSLILFITSLLAAHFFLQRPWKKCALVLAVLPLAVVRNAIRIFTIGELCVKISPDMIDSYIHHHGGPIFFVLSLVPFTLLLYFFWRTDRPAQAGIKTISPA